MINVRKELKLKAVILFPNMGHLCRWMCPIMMRFLCIKVNGSKLAQPLIQRKNSKSAHFYRTEEYNLQFIALLIAKLSMYELQFTYASTNICTYLRTYLHTYVPPCLCTFVPTYLCYLCTTNIPTYLNYLHRYLHMNLHTYLHT
jgi:hypothetical protein